MKAERCCTEIGGPTDLPFAVPSRASLMPERSSTVLARWPGPSPSSRSSKGDVQLGICWRVEGAETPATLSQGTCLHRFLSTATCRSTGGIWSSGPGGVSDEPAARVACHPNETIEIEGASQ